MRIHILQHVPFEDEANIGVWAGERGHAITNTLLFDGQPLPPVDAFDWLAVMGGPMNIHEHDAYPWLVDEKAFLKRAVLEGKTIVGVCLGSQLLADVLGGPVRRNDRKEIGWFPVSLTEEGRRAAVFDNWPRRFVAFHWHGDTFAIPPEAQRLAESEACANQAFSYDDRIVGLQFHLEYTQESIDEMLETCGDELTGGDWVQSAEAINAALHHVTTTRALLWRLLDNLETRWNRKGGTEH